MYGNSFGQMLYCASVDCNASVCLNRFKLKHLVVRRFNKKMKKKIVRSEKFKLKLLVFNGKGWCGFLAGHSGPLLDSNSGSYLKVALEDKRISEKYCKSNKFQ